MSINFVWYCDCKHPKNVHKLDLQRRTGLLPYCRKCGASLLSYQLKLIAEENAEELRAARDLLRWRKVGEEMPETVALYLVLQGRMAKLLWWRGDGHDADDWKHFGVTHWRPIGPMPATEGEKP